MMKILVLLGMVMFSFAGVICAEEEKKEVEVTEIDVPLLNAGVKLVRLELKEEILKGLPKEFEDTGFSVKSAMLTKGNVGTPLPSFVSDLIGAPKPVVEDVVLKPFDGKINFFASWKHNTNAYPPFVLMKVCPSGSKTYYQVYVDLNTRDVREAFVVVDGKKRVRIQLEGVEVNMLEQLGEPVLEGDRGENQPDSIRFIYIPTFTHPVSIRAYQSKNGPKMRMVRMKGEGGYDWEAIETVKEIDLTKEQWNHLNKLVKVKWARKPTKQLPTKLQDNFIEWSTGLDGASWILEVKDKKLYTREEVWCPYYIRDGDWGILVKEHFGIEKKVEMKISPYINVCDYLMELAKPHLKFEKPESEELKSD